MKINLAVLFGGKSVEHEISVISAIQAMDHLDKDRYEVFPVYITKGNEFYYGTGLSDIEGYRDIPALLKKSARVSFVAEGPKTYMVRWGGGFFQRNRPIALIDVAFPIVHGTNVEDGALQGFLKTLNLPFVGCDVLPSAVCMDKYSTKALLREAGLPVLDCLRFTLRDYDAPGGVVEKIEAAFPYPVIVKPVNLGSSIGISRVEGPDALGGALDLAFSFTDKILVEPAIVNLREINCSVVGDGDEAAPSECEEPYVDKGMLSYADKYLNDDDKLQASKGMASLKRKIPADIPPELKERIQKMAVDAFRHLGCNGVVRVDFLMDGDTGEVWINEFNTIPGSLSFYLWEPTGLPYGKLLDRLVSLALKRQRKEEDIVFSFDTNILSSGKAFGSKGSKGGKA
ncbi:MAG: D-alanine--D-alanine ligase [Lachnospiraceae bacterium]|jgi:D-alanine-D-alanine ligase|nr:D-alanine--D-alanine ligase [Lachnospiraceae bacterium]